MHKYYKLHKHERRLGEPPEVKFIKLTTLALVAFLLTLLSASVLAPVQSSSAESSEVLLAAQASGNAVSLTTSGRIDLAMAISPSSSVRTVTDAVTVTAGSAGYQLYISTSGDNNDLVRDGAVATGANPTTYATADVIPAGGGDTIASPATLSDNTWGFALATTGAGSEDVVTSGFDESYPTGDDSVASSKFTKVPTKGNEVLIAKRAGAATEVTTNVYYGARVNTTKPSGLYKNTITYTAIGNGSATGLASVDPTSIEQTGGVSITISTPSTLGDASIGTPEVTVGGEVCADAVATRVEGGSTLNVTCIAPALAVGVHEVNVYLGPTDAREVYTVGGGIEYTEASGITTFQAFTVADCQTLEVGTTITLKDNRDDNTYTVAKLADGNCWQTQNLRLGSTDKAITLTWQNSDVSENFTIDPSDVQISGNDSWSDNYDTKHVYATGDETYGNYYNWYTATAGTGTTSVISGDALSSICPSSGTHNTSWKLPPNEGNGSYTNLFLIKLGWVSSTSGTDVTHFGGSSSTIAQVPYSFLLSGYYGSASSQESYSLFWSRTAYNADSAHLLYFDSSGYFGLQNRSYRYYGNSVRCVLTTPEGEAAAAQSAAIIDINNDSTTGTLDLSSIITMQQFSSDVCTAMKKSTASSNPNKNYTLKDSRDGKIYNVAKLDDGLCWMVQNLRLGSDSEIRLTADDTDITSDYYDSGKSYWATPVVQTVGSFSWTNDTKHIYQQASTGLGNLYNWYTATAGSGTASMSSGDADASICPKGWVLPSGGTETGSFAGLTSAASIADSSSGSNKIRSAPYSFTYAGYYNYSLSGQGSGGYYLSRTVYPGGSIYYLNFSSDRIYARNPTVKTYGLSVRCLFAG